MVYLQLIQMDIKIGIISIVQMPVEDLIHTKPFFIIQLWPNDHVSDFTFLLDCLTNTIDVSPSKVSQAVSVVCVGQEVEPPSVISLELAKENTSTLVLGLSSDGHLSLDLSEYLVPSMNGAQLRCSASNGDSLSQTKHVDHKLEIIRKLEMLEPESQHFKSFEQNAAECC